MSYLPCIIVNKIILDSIILTRNDDGWREINMLIKSGCTYVKKTNLTDVNYSIVKRVTSFYSNDKPIFKWASKRSSLFHQPLYIYGNPLPSYSII